MRRRVTDLAAVGAPWNQTAQFSASRRITKVYIMAPSKSLSSEGTGVGNGSNRGRFHRTPAGTCRLSNLTGDAGVGGEVVTDLLEGSKVVRNAKIGIRFATLKDRVH